MTKRCKDCVARVFGACRGEFCQAERVGLHELAEREAQQRGHELGPFEKVKNYPIWKARCERCGREIAYTLDPGPDEQSIYGHALDGTCSKVEIQES